MYHESTLTVTEWIARHEGQGRAWSEFLSAAAAVAEHRDWDGMLRDEPRVVYDALDDQHFFMFKLDNNGTTLFAAHKIIDTEHEKYG